MSHSLIGGASSEPTTMANQVTYDDGVMHIDATPLALAGILIGAGVVLAALKVSGFKFVIGVGG